ncbi:hypothetical protein K466DRAFT_342068 [Polyporus arcularius HHB13444]|uniref:Uncharacterized protein n=1 Tax=Polyporus arcularius HHB13444 TaxID=1314778 RepID=A0A5C3NXT7_9APHY|nr:hypothetical protein K466DRAFT_342068 [Polyporus arcularius HHB13444]
MYLQVPSPTRDPIYYPAYPRQTIPALVTSSLTVQLREGPCRANPRRPCKIHTRFVAASREDERPGPLYRATIVPASPQTAAGPVFLAAAWMPASSRRDAIGQRGPVHPQLTSTQQKGGHRHDTSPRTLLGACYLA